MPNFGKTENNFKANTIFPLTYKLKWKCCIFRVKMVMILQEAS